MTTSKGFSLVFGSSLGLFLLTLAAAHSVTAQTAPRDASAPSQQIYVDDHCQVLDAGTGQFAANADVCHFDGAGVQRTSHVAAKESDGTVQHARVDVAEQTYMLQNIREQPVVFVVAHQVPDGWHVDSDPQPVSVKDGVAIFRVIAQPGQIVRLHVGTAHETPMDDEQ
jgi:hypothetical protein